MRWRIDLEYDGSAFAGWQLQPGERTVQGVVTEALAQLLQQPVRVDGGGRTDAGVHASQQVAAFDTTADRDERAIREGLNALLPEDVACHLAVRVPDTFDPRTWVRAKRYRYRFLDGAPRSPLRRTRVWRTPRTLDVDAMDRAVAALVGTHDFSAFRAAGCQARHATRTVTAASVFRPEAFPDEVWLEVRGNGFLRHMIRIVAGTLVEVGRGKRAPEWVVEVRDSRERALAGRTAPALGLTLVDVDVADGPYWKGDA